MSSPSIRTQTSETTPPVDRKTGAAQGILAWSSFFFALLQSICSFFAAVDGLRLLIGSIALSASFVSAVRSFHADWIRLPMIVLALVGSVLNLIVLAQIRRLRRRPAAQWRIQPPSPGKLRMERLQFALSIATLVLLGIEEYFHVLWHHHF